MRTAPAARRQRRQASLEDLVFKYGGVAGAVRRIVYRSKRPLAMFEIYEILEASHPQLKPARSQIEDIIQRMVERRHIEVITTEKHLRKFHLNSQPSLFPN